jgi:DNA helicase-2/ATP-dependent DNA helicase PcrA
MTMTASKGLTVEATIIAAAEDGVIPRPDANVSEERRLMYVAMTRAKKHLYCTWAQRRQGPTARAGEGRVRAFRQVSNFLAGGPVRSRMVPDSFKNGFVEQPRRSQGCRYDNDPIGSGGALINHAVAIFAW